ncbi:PepSY domain-containing protein [Micromonospora sp. NPDC049679]|uniref:PepSY domain-containing protein n=1 Tax=Micromonospora sp. NPDC049679 TaxID=3155920 RepID=UPI0033DFD5CD
MKRKTLFVLAAGAIAALAVTGTALGAVAHEVAPPRAAATTSPAPAAGVDQQRAAQIALARTGGGQVVEVERELEHGRQVWSVKVVKDGVRQEMHVDAVTGDVLRTSTSDDRGGRDDKGADDRSATGRDDKGGDRAGNSTDDRGYDDKGGSRAGNGTDDRGYDDNGGDRDDKGGDDKGGDDRGGR